MHHLLYIILFTFVRQYQAQLLNQSSSADGSLNVISEVNNTTSVSICSVRGLAAALPAVEFPYWHMEGLGDVSFQP